MLKLTDINAQVARLEEMQKNLMLTADPAFKIAVEQALATAYVAQELHSIRVRMKS